MLFKIHWLFQPPPSQEISVLSYYCLLYCIILLVLSHDQLRSRFDPFKLKIKLLYL